MRSLVIAALLLTGCAAGSAGRQLGNGEWIATNINGVPVIAGSRLTLRLDEGRVSGNSGCNSFGGTYERRSRERIRFMNLTQTRVACQNPALMEQEQRFSGILNAAEGYSVYGNGDVSLIAADGRAIRFRRSG